MRIRPKIGLRIEGKIFWCVKLGHSGEKKEEEKFKKSRFGISLFVCTLVWNSCMEPICLEILV